MSSLAEVIPIELVNHILSFRPRHPDAEIIKKLKKRTMLLYMANNPTMRKSLAPFDMTFKELDGNSRYYENGIFSHYIVNGCIYKIKTKKYKNSEEFYWGKYYTHKKAIDAFAKYCNNIVRDMYSVDLVIICKCCNEESCNEENIVESMVTNKSEEEETDSDNSDDGYEEEEEFKETDSESEEEEED
jgi:hypothetical protein